MALKMDDTVGIHLADWYAIQPRTYRYKHSSCFI